MYQVASDYDDVKNQAAKKLFNWYQCKPVHDEFNEDKKEKNNDPLPMIYVEDPEEISTMLAVGDQYIE